MHQILFDSIPTFLLLEPLLTFGLYDKLLNAFDNYYESGEKTATEQISKVLTELPSINSLVLRYLCTFLFEVSRLIVH